MSKIQLSELSQNTSKLEVLNEQKTADIIGGDIINIQTNYASVSQGAGGFGINFSSIYQNNTAVNYNKESYKTVYKYKFPWYYKH